MLDAIRKSQGTAIAVSDAELLEGVKQLSCDQGIYACPEGGAVWVACRKLAAQGWLSPEETIVLFNTGSGLKYNHLFPPGDLPVLDHQNPSCLDALA
jgi:threonine synthase